MKKIISLLLCLLLTAATICGCAGGAAQKTGLSLVVTVFPEYDWVKNILGETDASISVLMDSGVDLHSYQPSADDLIRIKTCDLFVYVGGESDEWAEKALDGAKGQTLCLLDVLGEKALAEETVEGMEAEEEEEEAADEHVWLSLKNASLFSDALCEKLAALKPDAAEAFRANAAAYKEKLAALDGEYEKAVAAASGKTLLFADRFPFRYLTEDYGLSYYAAFSGCSAESEASFETIAFLAGKADELNLPALLTLEGSDGKIAETVLNTTKNKTAKILTMDSLQSTTTRTGTDYLTVMEKNLAVLRQALG